MDNSIHISLKVLTKENLQDLCDTASYMLILGLKVVQNGIKRNPSNVQGHYIRFFLDNAGKIFFRILTLVSKNHVYQLSLAPSISFWSLLYPLLPQLTPLNYSDQFSMANQAW